MKGAAQTGRTVDLQSPTATCVVRFLKRQRDRPKSVQATPIGRIPRITRLLALAHRIDGMICSGEVRDLAEAARLAGVTRARMTQIANLLLLATEIQEAILHLPPVLGGEDLISEHDLRKLAAQMEWSIQATVWTALRERSKSPSAA